MYYYPVAGLVQPRFGELADYRGLRIAHRAYRHADVKAAAVQKLQSSECSHRYHDIYAAHAVKFALKPGSYVLRVEMDEGDTLTFRFGAPLGEIDSDIDPETGVSDVFRLQSGETRLNIDVGLTERAEK